MPLTERGSTVWPYSNLCQEIETFVLTVVGSGVCGSLKSSLAEDKAESDILCTD